MTLCGIHHRKMRALDVLKGGKFPRRRLGFLFFFLYGSAHPTSESRRMIRITAAQRPDGCADAVNGVGVGKSACVAHTLVDH